MKKVIELVYVVQEDDKKTTFRYKGLDRKLTPEGHQELLEGMERLTTVIAEK